MNQFLAMQSFTRVVEAGGFTEAARQLGVAVSSVTRQVNALETLLNTQLLNRSTRSITLTPQGQRYYLKAVQILQDIEAANLSVMEQDEEPRGLLRVSLPVAFGRLHIAPLLGEFLTCYPKLQLDLVFSDELSNPVEEGLDLIIRIGNLDRSGATWIVHKLGCQTRKVCGSPAYFEQYGVPRNPQDLANHNCLRFSYALGYDIWRFKRAGEIYEVKVKGSLIANNSEALRQTCIDGAGLILLSTWLIGEDLRVGRLQAVLEDCIFYPHADVDTGIYALYLPNRRHALKVQTLITFLHDRLPRNSAGEIC
ncbi:MAG: LysR family transcriptional regulator [Cyanobacteria bacterium P01_H01_bin.21]